MCVPEQLLFEVGTWDPMGIRIFLWQGNTILIQLLLNGAQKYIFLSHYITLHFHYSVVPLAPFSAGIACTVSVRRASVTLRASLLCFAVVLRLFMLLLRSVKPLRNGWWPDRFSQPWFIWLGLLASQGSSHYLHSHMHRCALPTLLRDNQWSK